jgi:hypothetical protein
LISFSIPVASGPRLQMTIEDSASGCRTCGLQAVGRHYEVYQDDQLLMKVNTFAEHAKAAEQCPVLRPKW